MFLKKLHNFRFRKFRLRKNYWIVPSIRAVRNLWPKKNTQKKIVQWKVIFLSIWVYPKGSFAKLLFDLTILGNYDDIYRHNPQLLSDLTKTPLPKS